MESLRGNRKSSLRQIGWVSGDIFFEGTQSVWDSEGIFVWLLLPTLERICTLCSIYSYINLHFINPRIIIQHLYVIKVHLIHRHHYVNYDIYGLMHHRVVMQ